MTCATLKKVARDLPPAPAAPPPVHPRLAELRQALEALGFTRREYSPVIAGLGLEAPVADLVKLALRKLRPPPPEQKPAPPPAAKPPEPDPWPLVEMPAAAAAAPPTLEQQIADLREDTAEHVRVLLSTRGKLSVLDRSRGKPAAFHVCLINRVAHRVGVDSPLGKALIARKEGLTLKDLTPCAACGLRGHSADELEACPKATKQEAA